MNLNLKSKLSNYGFWVSILSVIFLVVKQILKNFGIELDENLVVDIISGICFILITLGVISNPGSGKGYSDIKDDTIKEIIDKK